MKSMNRRDFLRKSGLPAPAMGLGAHALGPHIVSRAEGALAAPASEKVPVAIIGCGGMGSTDLYGMMGAGMVEVVAVWDVDDPHSARVPKELESRQGKALKVEEDFRRVIANRDIDAVVVGTPEHRHARAQSTPVALAKMCTWRNLFPTRLPKG
ncbi:Gfo/Idh/MocA family oxidoreductase [bacterium]|nr:Gfo/Idh/MocA family oxidoreductase [bacterium]